MIPALPGDMETDLCCLGALQAAQQQLRSLGTLQAGRCRGRAPSTPAKLACQVAGAPW